MMTMLRRMQRAALPAGLVAAGLCCASVSLAQVSSLQKAGPPVNPAALGVAPGAIAALKPPTEQVELTIVVNGHGRVTGPFTGCLAAPNGSNICKRSVPKGKTVVVEAVPGGELAFTAWAGSCKGGSIRCLLTLDANAMIAATFNPPIAKVKTTIEIDIQTPGGGAAAVDPFTNLPLHCERKLGAAQTGSCKAELEVGTVIALTATPESEVTFKGWDSPISGCNGKTCQFTLTTPTTVHATFTPPDRSVTLTYRRSKYVIKTGSRPSYDYFATAKPNNFKCTSTGTWTPIPDWPGYFYEDFTCTTHAQKSSILSIDVRDAVNVDFNGAKTHPIIDTEWGGDCTGKGSNGICPLTVDGNKSVKVCTWQTPFSICQ